MWSLHSCNLKFSGGDISKLIVPIDRCVTRADITALKEKNMAS